MEVRESHINRQSPVFGWSVKTHAAITDLALAHFPELSVFRLQLLKGSVRPDFSPLMTGVFSKKHNYNGEPLSLAHCRKNAFDMFAKLNERALKRIEEGRYNIGMKLAGMALHFLQDAMCPPHQTSCYWIFKIFSHLRFESQTVKRHNELTELAHKKSPGGGIKKGFETNFLQGYRYVKALKNGFSGNELLEKSYLETLERTRNYLLRILEYKKAYETGDRSALYELKREV